MNNLKPINNHEPTFRNAHFLKPIAATSTHQLTFNPSSSPVFIPEGR